MAQLDGKGKNGEQIVTLTVEKGKVTVSRGGSSPCKPAIIQPGEGVSIKVNGREIAGKSEVVPGDIIVLTPLEEINPEKVEVKISADLMRAEACYSPGQKKSCIIEDHPPTDNLTVGGKKYNEEIRNYGKEEVLTLLKSKGVAFGIIDDGIEALFNEPDVLHTVAKGVPVKEGKHGWVELLFEGGMKTVSYDQDAGKVDYRKRFEIEQVSEGDIIAVIHDPVKGEAGKKVTGEEIKPAPVVPADVRCEHGTELSTDSKEVIATRKGVPFHRKSKAHFFRVDDFYHHKGDVDIKSGNIYFHGHLKIQGDLTEGMKASADGNIELMQNASGAEIQAGGNIIIKGNCIKSVVQAGWVDLVLRNIYTLMDDMEDSLENAVESAEELVKALKDKGKYSDQMEAAITRALLQNKFFELPDMSTELLKHLKEAEKSLPEIIVQAINHIAPVFVDFQYSQNLGRETLKEALRKLQEARESRDLRVESASITAPYIQNSVLTCTGDIEATGSGVYNSRLKCSGEARVARLFRGGNIEAGGDVYIGEAGVPRVTADQGLIQVSYKGTVYFGTIYENMRVKFGATEYRCDKTYSNIKLILDQKEFEVRMLHWDK